MTGLDLPPPPVFPKPAIIRPAEHTLLRPGAFRPCSRVERRAIIADLVKTRRLTPAEAERAVLFVPVVGWRTTVQPPEVSFTATTGTSSNNQNFTFSDVSIGTASADRVVLVGVGEFTGTRYLTGCTIGGVAATSAIIRTYPSSECAAGWFYLPVASGTTATIVVQNSVSGVPNCQIRVYTIRSYKSATPYATGQDSDVNATTLAPNVDVPQGGSVVLGAFASAWNGAHSHSWSALAEQDEISRDNNTRISFAQETLTGGGFPFSVTAQTSNTREALAAATVCWQ